MEQAGEEEGNREHGRRDRILKTVSYLARLEDERSWLHRQEVRGLHMSALLRNLYSNLRAGGTRGRTVNWASLGSLLWRRQEGQEAAGKETREEAASMNPSSAGMTGVPCARHNPGTAG